MTRAKQIAKEMSMVLPTLIRHMFPFTFGPLELPPSQVLAIVYLYEKGRCPIGDLSKAMHVSAPTVSGIVDRLENSGYLKREPDTNDRRVTNIILTKKGIIMPKLRV